MLKKLKNKLAFITAILLFALIMTGGYFLIVEPTNNGIEQQERERDKLIAEIKIVGDFAQKIDLIHAQHAEAKDIHYRAFSYMESSLQESETETLLTSLVEVAAKHDVTLSALIPGQIKLFKFLQITPYKANASGQLTNLIRFISAVSEKTGGNITFSNINFQPQEKESLALSVNFIMETVAIADGQTKFPEQQHRLVLDRDMRIVDPTGQQDWNKDTLSHYQELAAFSVGNLFQPFSTGTDAETNQLLKVNIEDASTSGPAFKGITQKLSPHARTENIDLEPMLIDLLDDPDKNIQAAAIFTLGMMESQKALPKIAATLISDPILLDYSYHSDSLKDDFYPVRDGLKAYGKEAFPIINKIMQRIGPSRSCDDLEDVPVFGIGDVLYSDDDIMEENLVSFYISVMHGCEAIEIDAGSRLLFSGSTRGVLAFYEKFPQGVLSYSFSWPPKREAAIISLTHDPTLTDSIKQRAWHDLLIGGSVRAMNDFLATLPYPELLDPFIQKFLGAFNFTVPYGLRERYDSYDNSKEVYSSLKSLNELNEKNMSQEEDEKLTNEILGREDSLFCIIDKLTKEEEEQCDNYWEISRERDEEIKKQWQDTLLTNKQELEKWQQENSDWFSAARQSKVIKEEDITELQKKWELSRNAILVRQQMKKIDKNLSPAQKALEYKEIITTIFGKK